MPKAKKVGYCNYKDDRMQEALRKVSYGMSTRVAAKLYNVPRSTLRDKTLGRSPKERKLGANSFLSQEVELALVHWVSTISQAGFNITHHHILDSVFHLLKENNWNNPFTDGRPGRSWLKLFTRRHPTLVLNKLKDTKTGNNIVAYLVGDWFSKIKLYLEQKKLSHVLLDPTRVYNCDKTVFCINSIGNKALSKKFEKSVHKSHNSKECVTVLLCGNATGELSPPMVVFKNERIPHNVTSLIPKEWGVSKSEDGCVSSEAFYKYLTLTFYPWLVAKKIAFPVLLFIDGTHSHVTMQASKFCESNGIILLGLLANANHLLQPMKSKLFPEWTECMHQVKSAEVDSPVSKKPIAISILQEMLNDQVTPDMLQDGFRQCGLVPWNMYAIDLCQMLRIDKPEMSVSTNTNLKPVQPAGFLEFFENLIGNAKVQSFHQSAFDTWTGAVEDTSLFHVWKRSKGELQCLENVPNLSTFQLTDSNNINNCRDLVKNTKIFSGSLEDASSCRTIASLQISSGTRRKRTENVQSVEESCETENSKRLKIKNVRLMEKVKLKLKKKEELKAKKKIELKLKKKEDKKLQMKLKKSVTELNNYISMQKCKKPEKSIQHKKTQDSKDSKSDDCSYSSVTTDEEFNKEPIQRTRSIRKINGIKQNNCKPYSKYEKEKTDQSDYMNDNQLKTGTLVLVKFLEGRRESKLSKYVCLIQNDPEMDKVKVLRMIACNIEKKAFVLNENDVSHVINKKQIIKVLPTPTISMQGARIKCLFENPIDGI